MWATGSQWTGELGRRERLSSPGARSWHASVSRRMHLGTLGSDSTDPRRRPPTHPGPGPLRPVAPAAVQKGCMPAGAPGWGGRRGGAGGAKDGRREGSSSASTWAAAPWRRESWSLEPGAGVTAEHHCSQACLVRHCGSDAYSKAMDRATSMQRLVSLAGAGRQRAPERLPRRRCPPPLLGGRAAPAPWGTGKRGSGS